MNDEIASKDIEAAIDRIARTDDGMLLYLYLQKVRLGLTPSDAQQRALRANEGRRSFAADLMAHMGKGIRESGRADNPIVTFAVAGGARAVSDAGSGRVRAYLARDARTNSEPDTGAG